MTFSVKFQNHRTGSTETSVLRRKGNLAVPEESVTADAVSAGDVRAARAAHPKMRERDLAHKIGVSEARFLAAWEGESVTRLTPDLDSLFTRLESVGELMALTRNEHAVHEKIGVYENYSSREHVAMFLGETIDLRIFRSHWAYAFAVEKQDGEAIRRSLQFFDAQGEAVHKIHCRPASDIEAWKAIVEALRAPVSELPPSWPPTAPARTEDTAPDADAIGILRTRWAEMRDTHQFGGMLRKLGVSRLGAIRAMENEQSWRLGPDAAETLLVTAADNAIPLMVFVRNGGCLQVHSGPVSTIRRTGPWINVMDPSFHLHLRTEAITETWLVRKPTKSGDVLSVEAYDEDGERIILFNGMPEPEGPAMSGWQMLTNQLVASGNHQSEQEGER